MHSDSKKQTRSFLFRVVKYALLATGTLVLLLILFGVWIYFSMFSGPGPMEINAFHPFRSEKAKAEYLAVEDRMAQRWPVHSEELLVQTSFGKTFIRVSGPTDSPSLILLPGGGCNSLIWHANVQALSQHYRTFALDNIYDYGRSIYTREITSGNDYSSWINELLDTLRLGAQVRIVGYSYGGWVVAQYALHHPERLSRVILIAPAFTILPIRDEWLLDMVTTLIPIRYFKQRVMYSVWKDLLNQGDTGKELVDERVRYVETAYSCFKFKSPVNPTVLSDSELQSIAVPMLCLIGAHETMYNADSAVQRLHRVAPRIETDLISGTGHDLMFTHTEVVNRRILDFLRE
jgi:pimeloyl-ACP methyl ester carboxylesterase